jgi:3-methyladenine DNA glycosylase AlkD
MLREVGKRNLIQEEKFLDKYHRLMPRTMLRYAIERFDKDKRAYYMEK